MDNQLSLAVTVADAAEMLSVSRRTIYRLVDNGKLRMVRITPDAPRIVRADLDNFLASAIAEGVKMD